MFSVLCSCHCFLSLLSWSVRTISNRCSIYVDPELLPLGTIFSNCSSLGAYAALLLVCFRIPRQVTPRQVIQWLPFMLKNTRTLVLGAEFFYSLFHRNWILLKHHQELIPLQLLRWDSDSNFICLLPALNITVLLHQQNQITQIVPVDFSLHTFLYKDQAILFSHWYTNMR